MQPTWHSYEGLRNSNSRSHTHTVIATRWKFYWILPRLDELLTVCWNQLSIVQNANHTTELTNANPKLLANQLLTQLKLNFLILAFVAFIDTIHQNFRSKISDFFRKTSIIHPNKFHLGKGFSLIFDTFWSSFHFVYFVLVRIGPAHSYANL